MRYSNVTCFNLFTYVLQSCVDGPVLSLLVLIFPVVYVSQGRPQVEMAVCRRWQYIRQGTMVGEPNTFESSRKRGKESGPLWIGFLVQMDSSEYR